VSPPEPPATTTTTTVVVTATTATTAPTTNATRISSNAYASGSNQNAGNFITDRPTTRVHAPPGGRSQISFGGDSKESLRSLEVRTLKKPVAPTTKKRVETAPKNVQTTTSTNSTTSRTSSNAYANGSNQNCGNFITDRPTTRVHAPPGGKSSITFG